METILMGTKEANRPGLVRAAVEGKITTEDALKILKLKGRQFRRLKARYRKGGVGALVHRLRGRQSNRRMSDETRQRVEALLRGSYAGLNDTHLTEKLREQEGLSISRATVQRIRSALKISTKRPRRPPKHRSRRLREGQEGALVQIDGSPYAWLEQRGPEMSLIGAVDDATGRILGVTFRPTEDLHGYATVFRQIFTNHGLPLAVYGDGTNILVRNDNRWTLDEELKGEQNPTHLGRVLEECGIRYIRARSPQAKGRIENRWGTLQDRLTAELRLRGISTLDEANAFLPEFFEDFNRRFVRSPRDAGSAWRRPPRHLDLALSCRYQRLVAGDNTVTLAGHRKSGRIKDAAGHDLQPGRPAALPRMIQIPPGPKRRSYARCRVELRELLDGRLIVLYQGRMIASQSAPPQFILSPRGASRLGCKPSSAVKPVQSRIAARRASKRPTHPKHMPAPNHPWRRGLYRRPHGPKPQHRPADISIEQ